MKQYERQSMTARSGDVESVARDAYIAGYLQGVRDRGGPAAEAFVDPTKVGGEATAWWLSECEADEFDRDTGAHNALAERPDDPDGGRWFADRVDVYETMPCGCRGDQPSHTCTFAERPAEPEPDLVAALAAVLRSLPPLLPGLGTPVEEVVTRLAAVAQARIDAAVNADRDRIREALVKKLGYGSVAEGRAYRAAIAVVDEGGQR